MLETNKELEMAKNNISKVRTVFKVAKIVSLVLAGICMILAIIALIFLNSNDIFLSANDNGNLSFVFKIFNLELTNYIHDGVGKYMIAGYCLGFGIVFGITAIIFEYMESIFKVISEGESLFTDAALKKLRKGFILFTILTFLETGLLVTFFAALILWSIYTLFKYACVLQKESDETL